MDEQFLYCLLAQSGGEICSITPVDRGIRIHILICLWESRLKIILSKAMMGIWRRYLTWLSTIVGWAHRYQL